MRALLLFVASSIVAAALTASAFPRGDGKPVSATRAFTSSGRRYSVGKPAREETVIRQVLSRMGFDLSMIPPGDEGPDERVVDVLKEIPSDRPSSPAPLPLSLRADSTLQMETDASSVDISTATDRSGKGTSRKALAAAGWQILDASPPGSRLYLATRQNGKETSIVFLDEMEGECLFFRRVEN